VSGAGYKNRPVFLKIIENRWNQTDLNLKTVKITVYCFNFLKKIKISKIYVKNRSNSKCTGEEIFVKSDHLGW
jgi:hypothetical protein